MVFQQAARSVRPAEGLLKFNSQNDVCHIKTHGVYTRGSIVQPGKGVWLKRFVVHL